MGDRGHYFLFTKFFEIFYMFKIFCMLALDSFVTFSPKLSKFSGRGGGSVRCLCDILINFQNFSLIGRARSQHLPDSFEKPL